MSAPAPIQTPQDAIDALLARLTPVGVEPVPLAHAVGRVCAEPIRTDRPSPPADVSAMDGYALRLADARDAPQRTLPVAAAILPGQPAPPLPPGQAMRIMTGAGVPENADAVVRREDTDEHPEAVTLHDPAAINPGQHIRRRGENLGPDETALEPGHPVTPTVAAALATFGYGRVTVNRRVRVAAVITGDELLDAHQPAEPWHIRDSNGPALHAMLSALPWLDSAPPTRAADDPAALAAAVAHALEHAHALLLTGGVSMGTHDFVPAILREAGCEIVFHKLNQRPGKPLLGAIGPRGQLVLGLPGNPMSVMVTARAIAAPLLRRLAGHAQPAPPRPAVTLAEHDGKAINIWWHRPVRLTADGHAELIPTRGSGDLVSMARSDGFIQLPPNADTPGPWPFYRWEIDS